MYVLHVPQHALTVTRRTFIEPILMPHGLEEQ